MTAFPGKTASVALGLDKRIGLSGLNIFLAILSAATLLSLPVGLHPIHCVGGMLMLIGCGVHLVLYGRWINAVILKTPNHIAPALNRQRRLFWGMLLSGLFCGLSGLVSLPFHVHDPLVALPVHYCVASVHAISGLIFCGLTTYHLVLHRSWFAAKIRGLSAATKS